jgi:hypothetical protein
LALLVAPLAGIALLSAAAAVALNPVLVNINLTGNNGRKKRKKRFADDHDDEAEDMLALPSVDNNLAVMLGTDEGKLQEVKVNKSLFLCKTILFLIKTVQNCTILGQF